MLLDDKACYAALRADDPLPLDEEEYRRWGEEICPGEKVKEEGF